MKPLSLICITSILTTIYLLKIIQFMVDLAVITALIHSGSLGKNFVKFMEKKFKMLFTSLGRSVLGKTVQKKTVLSTALSL